jgi:hypothetical protein
MEFDSRHERKLRRAYGLASSSIVLLLLTWVLLAWQIMFDMTLANQASGDAWTYIVLDERIEKLEKKLATPTRGHNERQVPR